MGNGWWRRFLNELRILPTIEPNYSAEQVPPREDSTDPGFNNSIASDRSTAPKFIKYLNPRAWAKKKGILWKLRYVSASPPPFPPPTFRFVPNRIRDNEHDLTTHTYPRGVFGNFFSFFLLSLVVSVEKGKRTFDLIVLRFDRGTGTPCMRGRG